MESTLVAFQLSTINARYKATRNALDPLIAAFQKSAWLDDHALKGVLRARVHIRISIASKLIALSEVGDL